MIRIALSVPLYEFDLDVDVELDPQSVTALFGPSGAGKTTLLETIAGVRTAAAGEIRIDDDVLFSSDEGVHLPPEKRRIGLVPQDALLFPHMSVQRNITYGETSRQPAFDLDSVVAALEIEHLLDRRPALLSGGERQRVALARTLVTGPRLLALDEPLAALDVSLKERILPYLKRVRELYRIPTIVVSHDVSDVLNLADEMLVLDRGKVVARGEPRDILSQPVSSQAFFRAPFENVIDATAVRHDPDEGVTEVETENGLALVVPRQNESVPHRMLFGVFAEDILLALKAPDGLSARNILPGKIASIDERAGVAMLCVETPEPLYVRLTHRAVSQLGLTAGMDVHLIIKTHSLRRLEAT